MFALAAAAVLRRRGLRAAVQRAPARRADAGEVPAPVGGPVAVRGLLRGARPGLLQGPRARCHAAARRPERQQRPGRRDGRRRHRDRLAAEACSSRARAAPTSCRSPRSSSARAPGWSSFKDKPTSRRRPGLAGKKIGSWLGGNEPELFAGADQGGLDPTKENVIKQNFDMSGLLKGDLDVAQAMIYNEYAQVLEAKNPTTGKLYQPSDLNLIDFNDPAVGTAMLQDQVFATRQVAQDGQQRRHRHEVPAGHVQGLDLLPRQRPEVRRHRARQGLPARAPATRPGR